MKEHDGNEGATLRRKGGDQTRGGEPENQAMPVAIRNKTGGSSKGGIGG